MSSKAERLLLQVVDGKHRWKMSLLKRWGEIAGRLGKHVKILRIDGGVLVLGVVHPCWSQELVMMSERLLDRINSVAGSNRVRRLRFEINESCFRAKKPDGGDEDHQLSVNSVGGIGRRGSITAGEEAKLASVEDVLLRDVLRAFCLMCKERRNASRMGDLVARGCAFGE